MDRSLNRSLIGARRAPINFGSARHEKDWGGHAGPPLRLVATALCLAAQCEAPRTNINNGVVVIAKPADRRAHLHLGAASKSREPRHRNWPMEECAEHGCPPLRNDIGQMISFMDRLPRPAPLPTQQAVPPLGRSC